MSETTEGPQVFPIPEKYKKLPKGWEEQVLTRFEEGYTNEEIIAWFTKALNGDFSATTFGWWYNRVPHFKFIIDIGAIYKKAWWLSQGRTNISNGKFNTPLYVRMMANLFAWRTDSSVIESIGDKVDLSSLSDEDLKTYRELRNKMKQQLADGNGIVKKPGNGVTRPETVVSEFAGSGRD